jgi:hypothetical protein
MPYERFGYALLPGYNGLAMPSAPVASEQIAPHGTLWSLEPPQNSLQSATGFEPNATPHLENLPPAAGPAPSPAVQAPVKFVPMRNG